MDSAWGTSGYLTCLAANDTLLGGAGSDTYHFTGTFGKDTIQDSDGSGTGHITLDGAAIGVAKGFGKPNQYKADLGGWASAILSVFADSASSTGYRLVIAKEGDSASSIILSASGAIDSVAANVHPVCRNGMFSCENMRAKAMLAYFSRPKHRKTFQTAHAYSTRLAGQKGLGRRMDSAWGTSGYLTCIAANARNSARSVA